MKNLAQARHRSHLRLAAVASAIGGVGATLYWFPPEQYGFYPQCPFHAITGLLCPGCGATRALAALVHGHPGEAMHYNALVVLLLPVLLIYAALAYWRAIQGRDWPTLPDSAIAALLVAASAFGVVRNLS